MPKRKQPEGEAAGGGGPFSDRGGGRGRGRGRGGNRGGYNSGHGNYQGHGNWGNPFNYPMTYPNYPPDPYGHQPPPAFGSGHPYGQYPPYPPMGPGYNTYQFDPDVPW
ncbi:hypothetical protein FNYG_08680 [Fusarium nygamai]|uniref:Uncharacterized protein n=1 Tax=Gibberella nygamai TaxID=42673 RepID=A0A2K0W6R7_GIBNY|nr:hypothetical protein FNYG_08680 [Fusarium nygamai]